MIEKFYASTLSAEMNIALLHGKRRWGQKNFMPASYFGLKPSYLGKCQELFL
jgi:hypothetical protein